MSETIDNYTINELKQNYSKFIDECGKRLAEKNAEIADLEKRLQSWIQEAEKQAIARDKNFAEFQAERERAKALLEAAKDARDMIKGWLSNTKGRSEVLQELEETISAYNKEAGKP